jgi:hypothetical protein
MLTREKPQPSEVPREAAFNIPAQSKEVSRTSGMRGMQRRSARRLWLVTPRRGPDPPHQKMASCAKPLARKAAAMPASRRPSPPSPLPTAAAARRALRRRAAPVEAPPSTSFPCTIGSYTVVRSALPAAWFQCVPLHQQAKGKTTGVEWMHGRACCRSGPGSGRPVRLSCFNYSCAMPANGAEGEREEAAGGGAPRRRRRRTRMPPGSGSPRGEGSGGQGSGAAGAAQAPRGRP